MNETNENNVSQAPVEQSGVAPVAPVTPSVQPSVDSVQNVANVTPTVSNDNTNVSVNNTPETTNQEVSNSSDSGASNSSGGDNKNDAKLRFPILVVVILVIFIIFMFIYYFVLITPENLFNKALKAQIGGIVEVVSMSGDSKYSSRGYKLKTSVKTKGEGLNEKESVVFLDGLEYNFNLQRDIKNGNLSLNVLSNVSDFENVDKMQHVKNLDSTYYYYNQSIYAKASNDILKTDTHGDTSENTLEIFNLIKEASFELIDLIDISKVERSIASKSVKNQSLLAIKFNTEFTNEEINKMYQTAIDNLLDNTKHPDFVKKLAENLDITEQQAKETIESFKERKIKAENIKLNYYLNLACTGLVAYELTVDDTLISMSYLSGYYFIEIDSANDVFDIDLNMNTKTGDFDFAVLLNNKDTYTYVVGESVNVLNDKYLPIGNDLVIDFYEETEKNSGVKKDKPYLTLSTHTDFEYDKEIKFFDEKKSIPFEQGSAEDLEEINYTIEKLGYEFAYLLGMNLVNRTDYSPADYAKSLFNIEGGNNSPEVDNTLPEEDLNVPVVDNVVETPSNDVDNNENVTENSTKSE